MKKMLSMLSALIISASSASTVLACSTTQATPNIDNAESQAIRNEAVDSLKSFAIADQYGTDLTKTVNANTYLNAPDINSPATSTMSGLNLNGTIGKDNLPLYEWNDKLNKFLGTFGIKPIDLAPYLDQWGGVIKEIPSLIKSGNINALLELLPKTLLNVANYITAVPVDPGSIDWFAKWIKANIKYVMDEFDLNARVKAIIDDAIAEKQTPNLSYVVKYGLDSLQELGDFLFFQYMEEPNTGFQKGDDLDDTTKDSSISLFLGQEVFTKLFNGKQIDADSIKAKMGNAKAIAWYGSNMKEMIDDLADFLASIMLQLSLYVPMTMNLSTGVYKANDQDHLFFNKDKDGNLVSLGTNEEVFKKYEEEVLSYDSDGNIKIGDEQHNVSLDNSIYGVIDLVSNTDPDSFALQRLTSILFHDGGDNSLIDRLTYLLVDSLKFTDYQMNVDTNKSIPLVGDIHVKISFNLKDLFMMKKEDSQIDLVDGFSATITKLIVGGLTSRNLKVSLREKDNGLLGHYKTLISLVDTILLNGNIDSKKLWGMVAPILGTTDDSFYVSFHYEYWKPKPSWSNPLGGEWIPDDVAVSKNGWVSGTAWDLYGTELANVLSSLLGTLYYTDGTKFFDALKATGFVSDDQLTDMKNGFGKKLPLAKTVLYAMQHTALGDLTQYSGLVRLDNIAAIMKILFYENKIQDPVSTKTNSFRKSKGTDEGHRSLMQQIAISLNGKYDATRGEEWNYYLGYVTDDEIKNQSSWDHDSHYALREGLIGNLVDALYPNLDNANNVTTTDTLVDMPASDFVAPVQPKNDSDKVAKGTFVKDDASTLQAINLENLEFLDSEVMNKLDDATAKLSHDLAGDDINDIVDAVLKDPNQDKIWTTSNFVNKWFADNKQLRYLSFNVTFDSSSLGNIKHIDKDGNVVMLEPHKATYRVTCSRVDNNSMFEFKSIEKIS